ncbi:MAG: hypothetical protein BA874_01835 [Desulfuromonadales bacterium C00003068]|nr:MAG: hypothetical protein BA874_01835 [Desulfuromonadales bacterium C00003068]
MAFRNYSVMWFGIGMGFTYNAERLTAVLVEQQIFNTKFKRLVWVAVDIACMLLMTAINYLSKLQRVCQLFDC